MPGICAEAEHEGNGYLCADGDTNATPLLVVRCRLTPCSGGLAAGEIISRIEAPVFALAGSVTGGWQALWRAALEIDGVASRYLRMPMESATDGDMEIIRSLMRDIRPT